MKRGNPITLLLSALFALLLAAPAAQAVTVRGTPVTTMNAEDVDRARFFFRNVVNVTATNYGEIVFTPAVNKRTIIKQVGVSCQLPSATDAAAITLYYTRTDQNSNNTTYALVLPPLISNGSFSGVYWLSNVYNVEFYADRAATDLNYHLMVFVDRNTSSGAASCSATLSGYTIDLSP
jgi:hypothetical protein